MSIFHNSALIGSSGQGGDLIERSLRFNSADSTYLSRTPASAGNRKTWTWAGWVKRSGLSTTQQIFACRAASTPYTLIYFETSGKITFADNVATGQYTWTAQYRDPSAWYHIVLAVDTTQATASNRLKLYVNGVLDTKSAGTDPTPNADTNINSTNAHAIGSAQPITADYFSGYLADIHFIDGQALDPTSFGEFDDNGIWQPIRYTGTYGTNGFHLDFSDNSAATAAALGADSSGNGNNWTPNNLSVAAGAGNDSLVDVPTNGTQTDTGVGGQVRGNYATLNPLDKGPNVTISNGNLDAASSNSNTYDVARSTIGVGSGKWYWETTISDRSSVFYARFCIGISASGDPLDNYIGYSANSYGYFADVNTVTDSSKVNNNSFTSLGTGGYTTGDTVMIAFDNTNGNLWFGKNGTWLLSGDPTTGANPIFSSIPNGTYFPGLSPFTSNSATASASVNFGQRPFAYTAPSGFKALCTANLPAPTIEDGSTVMDVALYTGNNNTNAITGLGFSPDLVWIKARSSALNHILHDTVRGRGYGLYSNLTNAEPAISAAGTDLASFDSNGFTLGSNYNFNVNDSGVTFAAWTWDAGSNSSKTYTVTVPGGTGGGFYIDGDQKPTINLEEGSTYTFDQSDSSNSGHPFRFSETSDGTHGSGTEYTTNVTTFGTPGSAGAYTRIEVAASAPTLYYYCSNHSAMGGQINTNSTAGASNFDGSISSQVRVNTSAGFSIVTYTGTGSAATVGHGLGVAPQMVIAKARTGGGSFPNWSTYHVSIGAGSVIWLNVANGSAANPNYWNNVVPTSTVFSVGNDVNGPNASPGTYVAYCFAPVAGYSAFGSYTGNANTDGPFVYTGFRPAFLLIKRTNDTGNWLLYDNKRGEYNLNGPWIYVNRDEAEGTSSSSGYDFLSNGFKTRNTYTDGNLNGSTYVYAAFAENPFKLARAR